LNTKNSVESKHHTLEPLSAVNADIGNIDGYIVILGPEAKVAQPGWPNISANP